MELRAATPRSWSLRTACGVALLVSLPLGSEPKAITCLRSFSPPAQANSTPSSSAQDDKDARTLEPGKPIERELAGGESHSYQIALGAGQYLHVVVDQRGIDVAVTAFGPDGQKLAEVDSPNGVQGPEPIFLVTEAAGTYRLEVRSPEKRAPAGRYEVRIEELRARTAQDGMRMEAQRAFAEGWQLIAQGTAASRRQAIEKCETALPLLRAVNDRRGEADMLQLIGYAYSLSGERRKALDYYNQVATLRQAAGDRRGEAEILNNIGAIHFSLGEPQKALDYLGRALPLLRAVGDRRAESAALNNLGALYAALSENQKALSYYDQALLVFRALGDSRGEAHTLNNLGLLSAALGESQKALDYFGQALPLARALGERRIEAAALNNINLAYQSLGEMQKALDYLNRALSLSREVSDRPGEAAALHNIASIYDALGEPQKRLDHLGQALQLWRALGDHRAEALTLHNIGSAYQSLGERQKALDHFNQALLFSRAANDRRTEAIALNSIGQSYDLLGEPQKALEHFNQALSLNRAVGNRSGEAAALYNLARAYHGLSNFVAALTPMVEALEIIESLRVKVAGQQLRATYLASVQKYYEFSIDLLMRLNQQRPSEGHNGVALQISERARARSLLEALTEARADIRGGIDPVLLERERTLQRQLQARAEFQSRLLGGAHTEAQAAAVNKEVDTLTAQLQEVQGQIRHRSPRYAALTQPVPLSLREIQQQVLDDDTLLLEYALGEERSYLWAVTPTSITSHELPRRAEIEASARRLYDSFSMSNTLADRKEAAALSRLLLGPAAGQLGTKRLLIVAPGALQYLPFGALPRPVAGGRSSAVGRQTTDHQPLIVDHEIVSLPSASTLAVLRRELSGRQPAAKAVAVLADPVFDRHDPRVKSGASETPSEVKGQASRAQVAAPRSADLPVHNLERSAREVGLLSFDRLRSTRREADEIVALTRAGAGLKALDFEASRATAMSERLGQYRIVHFATHGLLNSQHPELSGMVFSLVDERGQPQDGFLRAHEVYNLKLGADLVVLSGCQTALGKEVKGEGLLGLTRGFMYAGAPRVVASLWRVPDQPTSELMRQFYKGMLAEGLRPAAALRAAQVAMWKGRRWAAPYYWAAFVLQGEWR